VSLREQGVFHGIITHSTSIDRGAFQLGIMAPNIQALGTAVAASAKIYNTIDRESPLDPLSEQGIKLNKVQGTLALEDIKHIYPSRPDMVVLQNVSLTFPTGKTTAIVGASGSGKSTIVGLIERFYDPVDGRVCLDGHDIKTLNLRWLRQQISLVSQEPTLFGTTIFDNIRYGLVGTTHEKAPKEKQRELVIEAAKKAYAHGFISGLPDGYETNVGEGGFLLSGGQKQRIAISRAIVSDPKILLLDEATSALDTKSEGVVQSALVAAAEGRTTITIAHRLSTIRDAANIVVMSRGTIAEQGTHDELLQKRNVYYNLVTAQNMTRSHEHEISDNDEVATDTHDGETRIGHTLKITKVGRVASFSSENMGTKLHHSPTQGSASSRVPHNSTQGQKPNEEQKYSIWTLTKLIASFNKPEWGLMVIGCLLAAVCGGGNPTQAYFFSKMILVRLQNHHHLTLLPVIPSAEKKLSANNLH
jgi:ATP-binding cassette, subfamily B (MDR/TAP), member 1